MTSCIGHGTCSGFKWMPPPPQKKSCFSFFHSGVWKNGAHEALKVGFQGFLSPWCFCKALWNGLCVIDGSSLWHAVNTLLWVDVSCRGHSESSWADCMSSWSMFQLMFYLYFLFCFFLFFLRSRSKTGFRVWFVCWTENVAASLFGSHVELMIRKLNFVC